MRNFSSKARMKMCILTSTCGWLLSLSLFFGIFGSVLFSKGCNPNNRNYCFNDNAFLGTVKKMGVYEKVCKLCFEKNCINYNCYNSYVFAEYENDRCVLFPSENEEFEYSANLSLSKYHLGQDVFWNRLENNQCNEKSKKYYTEWKFGLVLLIISAVITFFVIITSFINFCICCNTIKDYGQDEQQSFRDIQLSLF